MTIVHRKDTHFSLEGDWSGTEGRFHEHYIAPIPASRYIIDWLEWDLLQRKWNALWKALL